MAEPEHVHNVYCLIRAAIWGEGRVRQLVAKCPDLISATTSGMGETALHFLAIENDAVGVKLLFDLGAEVDMPDNSGNTPLISAAHEGAADVVAVLLECGANANAKNEEHETALHYAASVGEQRIVDQLLRLERTIMHEPIWTNRCSSVRCRASGSRSLRCCDVTE